MGAMALIAMISVVVITFSLMIVAALAAIVFCNSKVAIFLACLFHRCDGKVAHCRSPFPLVSLLLSVLLLSCRCFCICVVVVIVYSCGAGVEIPLSLGTSFVTEVVILP